MMNPRHCAELESLGESALHAAPPKRLLAGLLSRGGHLGQRGERACRQGATEPIEGGRDRVDKALERLAAAGRARKAIAVTAGQPGEALDPVMLAPVALIAIALKAAFALLHQGVGRDVSARRAKGQLGTADWVRADGGTTINGVFARGTEIFFRHRSEKRSTCLTLMPTGRYRRCRDNGGDGR